MSTIIICLIIIFILILNLFASELGEYELQGFCNGILMIFMIILTGSQIIAYMQQPDNFKPLYHVDPKQDNYIILNGEQYDTVPYGHLEEYIATDNL